jgi:hypothetical protein
MMFLQKGLKLSNLMDFDCQYILMLYGILFTLFELNYCRAILPNCGDKLCHIMLTELQKSVRAVQYYDSCPREVSSE